MIEHVLAESVEAATWPAIRATAFTSAGLVLIVIGTRRMRVRRRWERADEQRLLHPTAQADREPSPPKGGAMLVGGIALFLFGLAHALDLFARLIEAGVV